MEQEIYGDILLLIDFTMDFFALYIESYILKLKLNVKKSIFSALIGAIYSLFTVIIHKDNLFFLTLFAFLIIFISFGILNIIDALRKVFVFVSISFLLGGSMTAIFSFITNFTSKRQIILYGNVETIEEKMTVPTFFICLFISIIFVSLFIKIYSKKTSIKIQSTTLIFGGNKLTLNLFIDSGNLARDPISGDPIIFLTKSSFQKLLGKNLYNKYLEMNTDFLSEYNIKFRLISISSINGNSLALCIRPEKCIINKEEKRCFICLYNQNQESKYNYDGILPSSLI